MHKLKFEKLSVLSVEVIAGPLKVMSQLQSILQLGTTKFLSQRAPVTSEAESSVGRDEKWERGTAEQKQHAQTAQLLTRLRREGGKRRDTRFRWGSPTLRNVPAEGDPN